MTKGGLLIFLQVCIIQSREIWIQFLFSKGWIRIRSKSARIRNLFFLCLHSSLYLLIPGLEELLKGVESLCDMVQVCASKVYTSAEFKREKDNFQSLCKNLERAETKK